ncbi:glutaminase A [Nevskia soli]|uniref:glutaminase A n=1 Tax=Nevskia soli TaxID=418856 RepID=UPI0004A73CD8|nr:glutaminase A [Nevskia soli]
MNSGKIRRSGGHQAIAVSPLQQVLERLHKKLSEDRGGKLASYIPELAQVDPEPFGITLVTIDGMVYQAGDCERLFTIQSISKPLTYGYALQACGVAAVLAKIGVEPTGDAFNSISLEPGTGRPRNPMVNAGAIATCGLIPGTDPLERFERVMAHMGGFCGRQLGLNEAVYRSEKATGHRNRAIAHLLRNFNILEGDPEDPLDLYFRLCSVSVTCRDLATIAATLAHNGLNPLDSVQVLDPQNVRRVLSVMASCGMYDASGAWLYDVGMPAKSGVGGGIMAVLPGQFGLAVYSPRLDERGNSVRGLGVIKAFSEEFQLHLFHGERGLPGAIRAAYSGAVLGSRTERNERETRVLEAHGDSTRIFELKGRLSFGSIELLIREIGRLPCGEMSVTVLDLQRVTAIDDAATVLLAEACEGWHAEGRQIVFSGADHVDDFHSRLSQRLEAQLPAAYLELMFGFADTESALEWAEGMILAANGCRRDPLAEVPLSAQELLQQFSADEMAALESLLEPVAFARGSVIFGSAGVGDAHDRGKLYFLCSGVVSVSLPGEAGSDEAGQRMRLSVLWPGSAFGEIAVLDHDAHSVDVVAETAVRCLGFSLAMLRALPEPLAMTIQLKLTQGLAQLLARRLRRVNREFQALS